MDGFGLPVSSPASFLVSARRRHPGLLVPTMPRDACATGNTTIPSVFPNKLKKTSKTNGNIGLLHRQIDEYIVLVIGVLMKKGHRTVFQNA